MRAIQKGVKKKVGMPHWLYAEAAKTFKLQNWTRVDKLDESG
jgi:hypothetical protein